MSKSARCTLITATLGAAALALVVYRHVVELLWPPMRTPTPTQEGRQPLTDSQQQMLQMLQQAGAAGGSAAPPTLLILPQAHSGVSQPQAPATPPDGSP